MNRLKDPAIPTAEISIAGTKRKPPQPRVSRNRKRKQSLLSVTPARSDGSLSRSDRSSYLYSTHQRGQLEDLETSELLALQLGTFQCKEETASGSDTCNRENSPDGHDTGPGLKSQNSLRQRSTSLPQTTKKMVQLQRFSSSARSLNTLSKRNSRSISARAVATFMTADCAQSTSNATAYPVITTKKAEQDQHQRMLALANILSPTKAMDRCKALMLQFPNNTVQSKRIMSDEDVESMRLFGAAFRGHDGIFTESDSMQTSSEDDRKLIQLDTPDSTGSCMDENEEQDELRIEFPRTPTPERSERSELHSSEQCELKDEEDAVYDTDAEYLGSAPSTQEIHKEDCSAAFDIISPFQINDLETAPAAKSYSIIDIADSDTSLAMLTPVTSNQIPQRAPPISVLRGHKAAEESTQFHYSNCTASYATLSTPCQELTATMVVTPMADNSCKVERTLYEIPDSEDDEGFASNVDMDELLRDADVEDELRSSVRRLLHSERLANLESSPVQLTPSAPGSLLFVRKSPQPRSPIQVRTMATRSTSITPRRKRDTDTEKNGSTALTREDELRAMTAGELRAILNSWNFKAPRKKVEMVTHILHYESKLATSDDMQQISQPTKTYAEDIRNAMFSKISRYLRTAQSAREWWLRILTYEPVEVNELAQFLADEGVLTGQPGPVDKKMIATVKDWCDACCVCMINKDTQNQPRMNRKRKAKKAKKASEDESDV